MKLSRATKKTLRLSFMFLYGCGTLYWLSHTFWRVSGQFGDEPSLMEKFVGPLHLAAAFIFLFVFGMVWTGHIQPSLRKKERSLSGWIFIGLIAILTLSGVGMIYGPAYVITPLQKYHPYFGILLLPALSYHWLRNPIYALISRSLWMKGVTANGGKVQHQA